LQALLASLKIFGSFLAPDSFALACTAVAT